MILVENMELKEIKRRELYMRDVIGKFGFF